MKTLKQQDEEERERLDKEKKKEEIEMRQQLPKIVGQMQPTQYQLALQKRQQQLFQEKQRKQMVDLKLNYMVSDMEEKLGFVTKKQKMDHIMYRLASSIKKKMKDMMKRMLAQNMHAFSIKLEQPEATNTGS